MRKKTPFSLFKSFFSVFLLLMPSIFFHFLFATSTLFLMTSCSKTSGPVNYVDNSYSITSSTSSKPSSTKFKQNDLDGNRKNGAYYTKLNADANSHLPKGKPYKVRGEWYTPYTSADGFEEIGIASWYGPGFHGKLTANGEKYNQRGITAAHKLLPFGTMLRVTNLENGKVVVVRVNDRGPFLHDRIIDLSEGAAKKVDMLHSGTAKVHIAVEGASNNLTNFSPSPTGSVGSSSNTSSSSSNTGAFDDFNETLSKAADSITGFLRGSSSGSVSGASAAYGSAPSSANSGGFGLPTGTVNRYGTPVGTVNSGAYGSSTGSRYSGTIVGSVANPASPASSITSDLKVSVPSFSGSSFSNQAYPGYAGHAGHAGSVGAGTSSGFFSSDPNEFGDDPTYYQGAGESYIVPSSTPNYSTSTMPSSTPSVMPSIGNIPTNTSASSLVGDYFIQLGMFQNISEARNFLAKLKNAGLPAEIFTEKDIHFVQVGPFAESSSAVKTHDSLREYFPKAYFVIR